jgi:SAM-dependent methyltransferase
MTEGSRARRAGSFGRVVDEYERGRPNYPEDVVGWLVGGAKRAVDLGAGTGKLTSSLAAMIPEVVAVEPQETMVRRLTEVLPGAWAVCARAEALPITTGWADVVVVAQAFHWFDQDLALPEIARVLRSGGRLSLVWNVRDESIDWVAELARITGRDNSTETRGALRAPAGFADFEARSFRMVQPMDRRSLVAHVRSRSNIAALDEEERARELKTVESLCDTHPELSERDGIEMPYVTEAYRAHKL